MQPQSLTKFSINFRSWSDVKPMPGPLGFCTAGGGIAVTDLTGSAKSDLIVFHFQHRCQHHQAFYQIGRDLDQKGNPARGWSELKPIPSPFGPDAAGGGIAVTDLTGSAKPDLVVFYFQSRLGHNQAFYQIGRDLDEKGNPKRGWSDVKPIPGPFGPDAAGGGIAVTDLTGSAKPDLVVFHFQRHLNQAFYQIGRDLDEEGNPKRGWSHVKTIPGTFGLYAAGGGVAVADITGSAKPDLIVFHFQRRLGLNQASYQIGWDLDEVGDPREWSEVQSIPGWFGLCAGGGSIAVADITGSAKPDLIVFHFQRSPVMNRGFYRVGCDFV